MTCPRCIPCSDCFSEGEGDGPEHECAVNNADPCDNCRNLDKEADAAAREVERLSAIDADFRPILDGVKRLIETNGYCVVCEKYAPFHLIGCPVLRHR